MASISLEYISPSFLRRQESIDAAFDCLTPRVWIPDHVRDDEEKAAVRVSA